MRGSRDARVGEIRVDPSLERRQAHLAEADDASAGKVVFEYDTRVYYGRLE